nr:MAG TPA: hypothetical protein [Crassvirales sp.]
MYGSKLPTSSLVLAVHTSSAQFLKTNQFVKLASAVLRLSIFTSINK